ncbi:MAG: hypothetical protein AAF674_13090 [Pseudomonadota bacterium]
MRIVFIALALGVTFTLQGCVAAIGYAVGQAEAERVKQLELYQASLTRLDCDGLGQARTDLIAEREDLVDFDQREDVLQDAFEAKSCPWPDDA